MENLIKDVINELYEKYKHYEWFYTIGEAKDHIIFYTKKPCPEHLRLNNFAGIPVFYKVCGGFSPAA